MVSSSPPALCKADAAGDGVSPDGICCPGQGGSSLSRTEQGGGDKGNSSEEGEGGRKTLCCLLQVQPCKLLPQEMEKLGIWMRE